MQIKTQSLSPEILNIICHKGTEAPYSGEYNLHEEDGTYLCRQCGLALFRADSKFASTCGWPSFDAEIPDVIKHVPDADGRRTEILCNRCDAHLGHVFAGEAITEKNLRYCVNSLSMDHVNDMDVEDTQEAVFAAGCFWGVETLFKKFPGVVKTEVGYTCGHKDQPNYHEVCSGTTGHTEAIRVIYDPNQLSYEDVAKYFFEIHDPTQIKGQGPDIGEQYLSVVFYYDEHQETTAQALIDVLKLKGLDVVTSVLPVSTFWKAEDYHQDYYMKKGGAPYCHTYVKRFE